MIWAITPAKVAGIVRDTQLDLLPGGHSELWRIKRIVVNRDREGRVLGVHRSRVKQCGRGNQPAKSADRRPRTPEGQAMSEVGSERLGRSGFHASPICESFANSFAIRRFGQHGKCPGRSRTHFPTFMPGGVQGARTDRVTPASWPAAPRRLPHCSRSRRSRPTSCARRPRSLLGV